MACQPANHNFYVAEVVGVEAEGMVYILIACKFCGDTHAKGHKVSLAGAGLRLLREEKANNDANS